MGHQCLYEESYQRTLYQMITSFIGKFHVLFVHLPIGFLVMTLFVNGLGYFKPKLLDNPILPLMWKASFFASLITCLTGYLLQSSGDYDLDLTTNHMWMGLLLTALTGAIAYLNFSTLLKKILFIAIGIILAITGHLGGSLTHGEHYFTLDEGKVAGSKKVIPNIQEALVFEDVIKPILSEKCFSCHSSKKQKGELRLDEATFISKGGKNGACLVIGNAETSLLHKRFMLKESDEKHMPPKGKPQLTEQEKKLIDWWIDNGAVFTGKTKDIKQPENIKTILSSFQNVETKSVELLPIIEIGKADEKTIEQLKEKGIFISPIGYNSNYLSVSLANLKTLTPKDLEALLIIKENIVWLKGGYTNLGDELCSIASKCPNLRNLHLNNTNTTDKGLSFLATHRALQVLNLSHTQVTSEGIASLKSIPTIKSLFLFKSKVNLNEIGNLQKLLPSTNIDSGGYHVPIFETDTVMMPVNI
jgi:uncharacterized membrane protein